MKRGLYLLLLPSSLLTVGCDRSEVAVYKVAKEPVTADPHAGHQHPHEPNNALPRLTWTLPAGWETAAAGEMRFASFKVKGDEGKSADVGVFPLPGMAGKDLDNVNRWRGQVGQPPVTEEELEKLTESVTIDGQKGALYEMAGENPGSGEKTRVLAAILRRDGIAWFFKMTGDDALVAREKRAFVSLLESMKFAASATPQLPPSHPPIDGSSVSPQPVASAAADSSKPRWEIPGHWRELAAGQFLVAKYAITGDAGAEAAVNVSMSAGDGGGLAGNVNRWRGQLGLPQVSSEEIEKSVKSLETAGGKVSWVDLSGADPRNNSKVRVLGAMLPRQGKTWFYKLTGPESLVQREEAAFMKLIQTAQYPNAS